MPYDLLSKGGKFCMRSKRTGKTYCYSTRQARARGMRLHEAFSHGFVPTRAK